MSNQQRPPRLNDEVQFICEAIVVAFLLFVPAGFLALLVPYADHIEEFLDRHVDVNIEGVAWVVVAFVLYFAMLIPILFIERRSLMTRRVGRAVWLMIGRQHDR